MMGPSRNYSFSPKSETLRLCQLQWDDKASDLRWGKDRLSSAKSRFLLPSVVHVTSEAQSQPAVSHSHSLTRPDLLCTCAGFVLCRQKPSPFVWLQKLEMHLLNKGLHGFCALTVNTVW